MSQFFTPYQDYPIAFIAELITLLPLLIGLFRIYSLKRDTQFVLLLFVFFFLRDTSSNALAAVKENNLFIYNTFSFLEIIFLALIFYHNTKIHSSLYKRIILWGALICLSTSIVLYTKDDFSVGDFTTVRLYGIVLTVTFFERVLSEVVVKNILTYSMFWVSSGFLLYFCGTFFIFLLSDKVLSRNAPHAIFQLYWDTNLIFYIVLCLLSSVGIWMSKYDHNVSKEI